MIESHAATTLPTPTLRVSRCTSMVLEFEGDIGFRTLSFNQREQPRVPAVLRAGYVSVFVTDKSTASFLLDESHE